MNTSPLGCLGGPNGSGQAVLVDGLARALAALGQRVTIYVRRDDPTQPTRLCAGANVDVVFLAAGPCAPLLPADLPGAIDEFALRLSEVWTLEPPDAIHAFACASAKAATAAAREGGWPVVQTLRPVGLAGPRRVASEVAAALERTAARIVATSSSQVFALLSLGVSPAAIKLVPCGVDLELFAPAARTGRDRTGPFRIATLSGLGPGEGIADVIEALTMVGGVELFVGGGPRVGPDILADPDAERLSALAQSRGVGDRVHLRGRIGRDEAAAFLRSADAVICAPHADALGTVALEAMACGVPLIVSAVGGLVDVVADGMTGVHVPARAPRQIAYAIDSLRSDPARRARFGRLGVERARARYGWARIAGETLDVYRSVAERGARVTQRASSL